MSTINLLPKITNVFKTYAIKDEYLNASKDQIIQNALSALEIEAVDLSYILNHPEKILIILGVSEEWRDRMLEKQEAIRSIIKILAVPQNHYGIHGTYGEKLQALFEKKFTQDVVNCDPETAVNNYIRGKYIDKNIDKFQSWRAQKYVQKRGKSSILHQIRKRMNIKRGKERKFKVLVSSTGQQLMRELNTAQFVFYHLEKEAPQGDLRAKYHTKITPIILLSYGIKKIKKEKIIHGFLEHEYAHIQSGAGFTLGMSGLLFEGLNEAFTESLVSKPINYGIQREVLNILYQNNPEIPFKELLLKAYLGDQLARREFLKNFIKKYGLTGVSMLARMNYKTNIYQSSKTNRITDLILISPEKIIKYLHEKNSP